MIEPNGLHSLLLATLRIELHFQAHCGTDSSCWIPENEDTDSTAKGFSRLKSSSFPRLKSARKGGGSETKI